jgi:hypothetical protein
VRGPFGSRSRCVGLRMGFWVVKVSIWLRVKACRAWDRFIGRGGVDLAQGLGMWGWERGFGWVGCMAVH